MLIAAWLLWVSMSDLNTLRLIYRLVVEPSYSLALQQANRMDSKLQSFLAISGVLTFTMLLASELLGLSGSPWWMLSILIVAAIEVLVLVVGRLIIA